MVYCCARNRPVVITSQAFTDSRERKRGRIAAPKRPPANRAAFSAVCRIVVKTPGRRDTVIIANARHVPPQHTSVSDCMETLFGLVKEEKHPAVRAALAHVFYEYIHPYIDGNGRTGRFLMNVLFAAGGYPWVIVPFDQRKRYLEAMGSASERGDAAPLSELLLEGVRAAPTYRDTSTEKVERYYSRRP